MWKWTCGSRCQLVIHSVLYSIAEAYMVHLLVGNGSIVLKDVVIGGSSSRHQLLESRLNKADIWLAYENQMK